MSIKYYNEASPRRKKWIIGIGIVFVLWVIGAALPDKNKIQTTNTENHSGSIKPKERNISNEIDIAVADLKHLDVQQISTPTEVAVMITTFKLYWELCRSVNDRTADLNSVGSKSKGLSQLLRSTQSRILPQLRKKYAEGIAGKLWENDVYVSCSGKSNTVLSFTGSIFASNKGIKAAEDAINEMVGYLRFKQTQYRWYKQADDYQYFTYTPPEDSDPY